MENHLSFSDLEFVHNNDLPKMSEGQQAFLTRWVSRSADIDGGIPSRKDFPPNRFAPVMPHVIVFDVLRSPLDFHFRLFGTSVRDYTHQDFTGKNLSDMAGKGPGSKRWTQLETVIDTKKPLYEALPYVGPSVAVKTVTVLLVPMAKDHQKIDKIFQVTSFIMRRPITLELGL